MVGDIQMAKMNIQIEKDINEVSTFLFKEKILIRVYLK